MTTPTPESSPPAPTADTKTWAFWRLRLARALLVGGLLLAAFRLVPVYPHEHHVQFAAPDGVLVTALHLVWRNAESGVVLGGATLRLPEPSNRVTHRLKVPNGQYTFEIDAEVLPQCGSDSCAEHPDASETGASTRSFQQTVELTGDTARVFLEER